MTLVVRSRAWLAWMGVWLAFGLGSAPPSWAQPAAGTTATDVGEDIEERAVREAVTRVAPSVVRLETVGGLEQLGQVLLGDGPTTGLVVSTDGLILSSAFNFLRQPSSILVVLPGGRRVPARVVARDQSRMLVLLKVEGEGPWVVPAAIPLDQVRVGQTAIAVGRALSADEPNMSVGIISARNRIYGKAIQTDAKISPALYGGPLVDLRGRVYGVLVPMSPDRHDELAGAEWYDGGIGFAVPLVDVLKRLDRLRKGEDLQPGLLGISLKAGDMYSLPAEITAAHPKSPIYQAGVRAGDVIVRCNGQPVARQMELKHLLGPLYAGDQVQLVVKRGDSQRELQVELVAKLEPYEHPFLGVLPARQPAGAEPGVVIRYVYPESPASRAGLKSGDRIEQLADRPVPTATTLRDGISGYSVQQKVGITYWRGTQKTTVEVELASLPVSFPPPEAATPETSATATDAKPAAAKADPKEEGKGAGEKERDPLLEIRVPEEPNSCVALIPRNYRAEMPHGLMLVLPQPGDSQNEAFAQRWRPWCEKYHWIAVAPRASLPNMWLPTEVAYVRKVLDRVLQDYTVDRQRIVAYGYQSSGAMAAAVAFRHRDLVRGAVVVDSRVVGTGRPPENDPIERLALVIAAAAESPARNRILPGVQLLQQMKYPVTLLEQGGAARDLNDDELARLAVWVETLDRI